LFDFNIDLSFGDKKDHLTKNKWFIIPQKRESFLVKYKYAAGMAKELKVVKGTNAYSFVNGSFIFGDLIEALFVENNWHTEKLTIATLSMSHENIDSLYNILHGKYVDSLDLLISDYFFSHERKLKGLIPYMYDQYKDFNFQLSILRSHCKIVCFKNEKNEYITIQGSANLRSSGNVEQIQIVESKELYDYNIKILSDLVDKGKTIKKGVK